MEHKKLIAGCLLAIVSLGVACYVVQVAQAKVTELKTQIAAESIDTEVLRRKLYLPDGLKKFGQDMTRDELRQALFLCTQNGEGYRGKIDRIKEALGDL